MASGLGRRTGKETDHRPHDHCYSSGTAWRLHRLLARFGRAGVHLSRLRRLCVRREQQPYRLQRLPRRLHQPVCTGLPRPVHRREAFLYDCISDRAAPPERPQPLRRSHRFPAAICKFCSAGGPEGSGRQRSGRIPGLSGSVRQPRREPRQAGGEAEGKRLI